MNSARVCAHSSTNRSETLVVDLVATTYIDSAGINLLFALGGELHQRQQHLHRVVANSSPIARMIEISGLATAVPAHPTRARPWSRRARRRAEPSDHSPRSSALTRHAPTNGAG